MNCTCKFCGEKFHPDRETVELYEDGEIDRPDICDECFELHEHPCNDPDDFSDADPGM